MTIEHLWTKRNHLSDKIQDSMSTIRRAITASDFRIFFHQNSDNLHLKLMGDFDGSFDRELINILKKYCGIAKRVFIHTCSLSSIHPFGLDVFQKKCVINKLFRWVTFTGEYGNTMAP